MADNADDIIGVSVNPHYTADPHHNPMGTLIDGKAIAQKIKKKTASRVAQLAARGITPKLAVILVGLDKPSHTYVRNKANAAKEVGISFLLEELAGSATTDEVLQKIDALQADPELSGLIVQLPLPQQVDTNRVVNAIRPDIDVDCLTEANLGKLIMKTNTIVPPTPGAVMSILHEHNIKLVGTNVTIIGVGPLVGKPMAVMMMNERASVTTCNSATKDTAEKCRKAKVIVTGVGKADILRGDMVSPGAVVIDTGVDFLGKQMVGDVDVTEVREKADLVTPTPGGVGPITVARLLWNTVLLTEKKFEKGVVGYDADPLMSADIADSKTLIYKDLTYQINNILFTAQNEIGRYVNELQACDKIEQLLKEKKVPYQRELLLPQGFTGEKKGRNKVDFLIDNKVIIEVKAKRFMGTDEYHQLQRYLHALNKKLGILVNFRDQRLKPRRVLNPQYKKEQ